MAKKNCTWDGTDYNKNEANDGKYFVCIELTDKNAIGNYSKLAFTKGENNSVTPANVASFSFININWETSGTLAVHEIAITNDIQFFSNPT